MKMEWPDERQFAFTVLDDTDLMTLLNGPPVYRFIYELGFRTTKSVWPLKGEIASRFGGSTCEDSDYLSWVKGLKQEGFEIALHNVTYHTSNRKRVLEGLERFKEYFGSYPKVHANHTGCNEGIYWGDARLSAISRLPYNLLTRFKNRKKFQGHIEHSELFWGDICKRTVRYVRNFTYPEINTLKACPYMPYFDKKRPYVNYWFASSEAPDIHSFINMISEKNQDCLEEEGGACILYTHFAAGFMENRQLNSRFKQLMKRLSEKRGWFVPVSVLLDYIISKRGYHEITDIQRYKMEWKWMLRKLMIGGTA